MKKTLYSLGLFLLFVACASLASQGGGEYKGERTQLCISNQSGLPVHVYDLTSNSKQGVVTGSRGCVKLSRYLSQQASASFLCVRTLEMGPNACEVLPPVIYSNVPVWNLHLGPWTNTWYQDVYSLQPAPATD